MAAINIANIENRKPGIRKTHPVPKTDMTPMVDLGFLLISFFVITTELSKPMVTHLSMPKEGPPTTLGESGALTVLIGKNNTLFYYHGNWMKAAETKSIFKTGFSPDSGIGDVIRLKQQWLDINNKKEGRQALMLLIKPGAEADYGNVVDVIDQALINKIEKYAVLKPITEEIGYMAINQPY